MKLHAIIKSTLKTFDFFFNSKLEQNVIAHKNAQKCHISTLTHALKHKKTLIISTFLAFNEDTTIGVTPTYTCLLQFRNCAS